jgi:pyruvate dehydrogenase E1 component
MAFTRLLRNLLRDKNIGKRIVPIIPDEARTFGMDPLFKEVGIYSPLGQRYEPIDAETLLPYREAQDGQVLEEGITEAGSMASFTAAGTSFATHGVHMIPFYVFYSMFGMQRTGDQVWAFGDTRGHGFLLGATAGRTTLNGEGLQHEDGHSHLISSVVPNCISYDPTFAYEVAVIVQEGLRRMVENQDDAFYYITLMNENYPHPAFPQAAREGILKGMYKLIDGGPAAAENKSAPRAQLLGSGVILREVMAGAELLKKDWGVTCDVWSCPSFTELRRDGIAASRWNLLHPTEKPKQSYVEQCLAGTKGPVIASTDYMRTFADQIREFVPRRYKVLGTDGFGRSDSRENLRRFFEVNRHYVAVAALKALAEDGEVPAAKVAEAIKKYGIDAEKPAPWTV